MFLKLILFILLAVTLTAVTPDHGKQGDVIRLSASGSARTRVMVGSNLCGTLRRTETDIYCIVPPGKGTVDVTLLPLSGDPVVLKNAFTYDQ